MAEKERGSVGACVVEMNRQQRKFGANRQLFNIVVADITDKQNAALDIDVKERRMKQVRRNIK